jgi:integrase
MNTIISIHDINNYIDNNRYRWSANTVRNVSSTLLSIRELLSGDPALLERAWGSLKPYSQKTKWIIVSQFWDAYGVANPYREYSKKMQVLKHAYTRRRVEVDYKAVINLINTITDDRLKSAAMAILTSGVRFCELYAESNQGMIKGKGGRIRADMRQGWHHTPYPYSTLHRKLKKAIGLTPHDLRKLALTRLAEKGATAADLCEVAGWSSIDTAYYYLQSKHPSKLKEMLR